MSLLVVVPASNEPEAFPVSVEQVLGPPRTSLPIVLIMNGASPEGTGRIADRSVFLESGWMPERLGRRRSFPRPHG